MKKGLLLSFLILTSISVNAEFQKISSDGESLMNDNSEWSCVLDKKNSLVWEVKSKNRGLQYSFNTYTWFDGESGRESGTYTKNCYWGKNCNTKSYIDDINKSKLCSFSDWRLPTRVELKSIVDYYAGSETLIDANFFPNTQMDTYWTSTPVSDDSSLAYEIPFFFGGSLARDKTIDTFVRLVKSAD